jgi:hypothetical protein
MVTLEGQPKSLRVVTSPLGQSGNEAGPTATRAKKRLVGRASRSSAQRRNSHFSAEPLGPDAVRKLRCVAGVWC